MKFLKLKRVILVGLAMGMVFLTGNALVAAEKKPTVGFIISSAGDPYIDAIAEGAQRGADELGFELVLKNGQRDPALIDKFVRAFITQKIDIILLHTPDPKRLRPAVQAAYDANIPLIIVNTDVDAPRAGYVGIDSIAEGRKHGEIIAEALNGKGKIVNITGMTGTSITEDRRAGMEEVLAQYPDIEILDTQPANWLREEALTLAERFLIAYPDVDLIAVMASLMAHGVVEAVREAEMVGKVKIVCFDFPKDLIPLIENGELYGTSYTFPGDVGYLATEIAAFTLNSEYASDKWESVAPPAGGTDEPVWKGRFGAVRLGSKKATIDNIGEVAGDAF